MSRVWQFLELQLFGITGLELPNWNPNMSKTSIKKFSYVGGEKKKQGREEFTTPYEMMLKTTIRTSKSEELRAKDFHGLNLK